MHAWHWYFTEGLPVVLVSYLVYFVIGCYYYWRHSWSSSKFPFLVYSLGFSVLTLSLSPHKEYRFLLPYFPHMILLAAYGVSWVPWKKLFFCLVALQVPVWVFLSLYHQVGPLAVTDSLRSRDPQSVGFLIGCHDAPYYSHIHKNIPMRFLHCEPL